MENQDVSFSPGTNGNGAGVVRKRKPADSESPGDVSTPELRNISVNRNLSFSPDAPSAGNMDSAEAAAAVVTPPPIARPNLDESDVQSDVQVAPPQPQLSPNDQAEAEQQEQSQNADQSAEDDEAATMRLIATLMRQEEMNRLREWEEAQMQQVLAMSNADLSQLENDDADLALALRMQREEGGLSEAAAADLGVAVDAEENEDGAGLDVDNMDYDQLLNLGQQLGDVKTERWEAVSSQYIAKLSTFSYAKDKSDAGPTRTGGDHMCCVCQCDFEETEELMRLPCGTC